MIDRERTLVGLFKESVRKYPDKPAIIYFNRKMTYQELDQESDLFAQFLIADNVSEGDRVMFLMPNIPQFVIAFLGTLKAGATVAALNPLMRKEKILAMVEQLEPKFAIVYEGFSEINKAISEKLDLDQTMMVVDAGRYLRQPLKALYSIKKMFIQHNKALFSPNELIFYPPNENFYDWGQALEIGRERLTEEYEWPDIAPMQSAVLQYTGGTTGEMKAAVLTHKNLVSNTKQCLEFVNQSANLVNKNSVFLGVLPFFHVFGLSICLNMAFSVGSTVVLLPRFNVKEVFRAIKKDKVTILPAIPRMFAKMIEDPAVHKHKNFDSLKVCFSGGGALDPIVKAKFEMATCSTVLEGYGLSETSPVLSLNPLGAEKVGSLGKPLPETEIKIVDDEIWGRGPQVMAGYFRNYAETREAITDDGWFKTGDMGFIDEDGYVWMRGRKKRMLKRSGENVYAEEVEKIIREYPLVQDAAVLGILSGGDEKMIACVVPKSGASVSFQEIAEYCREKGLRSLETPDEIRIVQSIPRNIIGKLLEEELRSQVLESQ